VSGRPRLLLVRLSSLGDVVLSTSVLGSLREKMPGCHLTFLTRPRYADLFRHHPCLDEWIDAPDTLGGLADWVRFGASLRDRRFDAMVDLHYNWRTLAVSLGLAPIRVRRWDRANLARRAIIRKRRTRPVPHVVERFHRATRPWTGKLVHPPHVSGSPETWARAVRLLEQLAPRDAEWMGVVPVAHWATKRWPLERWAALCERWTGRPGRHAVVLFGPEDATLRARFASLQGGSSAVHAVDGLELGVVAEILRRMAVVVAGDTGLMHLSAAVEAPTIALYGPTSPAFGVAPYGKRHRVVNLAPPCQPCSLHGGDECPLGHHSCLQELTVDRVWSEVDLVLRKEGTVNV
jgi:heptosyltransferase II